MKQFLTIFKFELKDFITDKVFVGITLFLAAAIAIVMFIPNIISAVSDGSDSEPSLSEDAPIMLIAAEDDELLSTSYQQFKLGFPNYKVKSTSLTANELENCINRGEAECAFYISSPTSFCYYVGDLSMYDVNAEIAGEIMTSVYRITLLSESGLSPDEINGVLNVQISGETVSTGKNQMENFFYTYIMIFALYVVILLYGQMIATKVATEKSSRAMEVLITSVKPTPMMFGKVLASCIAGFSQLLIIFGSAILFYNINKSAWEGNPIIDSIFNIPPELLGFMLLFFVLGFLIYAFLYGAIGSTASKLEDINTSCTPLTFTFIIAFIIVVTAISSGDVDNIAMMICSYIPFTSPMALFARIAMSSVPMYEIIISVTILVGSVIGVGVLSARIYRVGVLLYGTKPGFIKTLRTVLSQKK